MRPLGLVCLVSACMAASCTGSRIAREIGPYEVSVESGTRQAATLGVSSLKAWRVKGILVVVVEILSLVPFLVWSWLLGSVVLRVVPSHLFALDGA